MVGEAAKAEVLKRLANGRAIAKLPKDKWKIDGSVVHVRFRSKPKNTSAPVWSFNINPNTITADFELWVCGSPGTYYLIPKATVHRIYHDPAGWPDHTHSGIRVAEVNTDTHRCAYGKERSVDLSASFKTTDI